MRSWDYSHIRANVRLLTGKSAWEVDAPDWGRVRPNEEETTAIDLFEFCECYFAFSFASTCF